MGSPSKTRAGVAIRVRSARRGARAGGNGVGGREATVFSPPVGVGRSPSPNFSIHRFFKEFSAVQEASSPSSTTRLANVRNSVKLKAHGCGAAGLWSASGADGSNSAARAAVRRGRARVW
ncbi:UNVERIFIED_CONTAM: hypothetical protein Sradi_6970200 [Sesamum radiatum]|uniref:Uncharacterized protein n=1 Tax=Sesamum radiatum TaxID=300843 RepID=A0AAW2JF13_SESRA